MSLQMPLDADLFEYGIHTERSDIRAHVSVKNKAIYVFQTCKGVEAVAKLKPPLKPAYQPGVCGATASGWVVPVNAIDDIRKVRFHSWTGWPQFTETLSTTRKGQLAVECVKTAMRMGRFPIWFDGEEDNDRNIQILGTDLLVFCRKKIQVKCDYRGGERPEGTGNLFLQKAERNPLRLK